ncbi:MAG: pyridoxal phosphate-dependent aminotransferase [Syntrophobacteraceae bacterium]|nr:pyridoxal phosphate-dependent aminotransferase [Syntrophobacteraceae bacterium]
MAVAEKMNRFIEKSSWIRKMFEEGARLKKIHGEDKVFDFSLGNPNVPPPDIVAEKLLELIRKKDPGLHAYMPNAGHFSTRSAMSAYFCREFCVSMAQDQIVVTCGAAGGLNIIFKALLDPGEEVLCPAPYFVEYNFYVDNHGGVLKSVPARRPDFDLDLEAMEREIGPRTKIVLINSPNNPTGQVYPEETIARLGKILEAKSTQFGHVIYLVSDEPYRKIVYDNCCVPCIFTHYANSLITSSYSKDLSLPGERIGFVALGPAAEDGPKIIDALTLANRILGFVNAPSLMQRLVEELQGVCVDVSIYKAKRDRLVQALSGFGYELTVPRGAFYLFPKSPLPDDLEFIRLLHEENILCVPGSGFGGPGYIRIAYCVHDATIEGALPGFERAIKRCGNM